MMQEYLKVDHAEDFPGTCVCGTQKGPLVATMIEKPGYGHVYLCRMCVTRSARALGMVKGVENERLEKAADHLDQAQKEIMERDGLIRQMSERGAEKDKTIEALKAYVETLQGEASQRKHLAELIASSARELVAA